MSAGVCVHCGVQCGTNVIHVCPPISVAAMSSGFGIAPERQREMERELPIPPAPGAVLIDHGASILRMDQPPIVSPDASGLTGCVRLVLFGDCGRTEFHLTSDDCSRVYLFLQHVLADSVAKALLEEV